MLEMADLRFPVDTRSVIPVIPIHFGVDSGVFLKASI